MLKKVLIFNSHVDGKEFCSESRRKYYEYKAWTKFRYCNDYGRMSQKVQLNDEELIKKSMNLILTLGRKDLKRAFGKNPQKALFGIVQGGLFKDLRHSIFRRIY